MNKPCKIWAGRTNKVSGYGYTGKGDRIHRKTWIDANGIPPKNKPLVLHKCNVRTCYELEHLYVGTYHDNMMDQVKAGTHIDVKKTHCPKGHPLDRNWGNHRRCSTCKSQYMKVYHEQHP